MYHVDVSSDFVRLKAFKGDDVSFVSADFSLEIFLAVTMLAAGFSSDELWVFMTVSFASCYPFKGSLRASQGSFEPCTRVKRGIHTQQVEWLRDLELCLNIYFQA